MVDPECIAPDCVDPNVVPADVELTGFFWTDEVFNKLEGTQVGGSVASYDGSGFVRDLEAVAARYGKRVVELRVTVSGRGAARDVTVTFEKIEVSVDGVERDRAARTIGTALVRRWAARRR